MKSKFILINGPEVYSEMRVHVVRIGISDRDRRKQDAITLAAARNHDIYFKKYDCDVCEFLRRLAEQVYDNLSPRDAFFKFNERNVREISLSQAVGLTSPSLTYPRLNLSPR